jgi:hypothetical protein
VQLLRVECQAGIADLIAGHAVIAISTGDESDSDTSVSWLQAFTDLAGHITSFRLTRFATGQVYDLPATLDGCTCGDATFRDREGGCKHQVGLRQALLAMAAPKASAEPAEEEWPDERWTLVEAVDDDDDQVIDPNERWTLADPDQARASA